MEEERKEGSVFVKDDEDKLALQFMDSLHNYLSLTHSLSSALRQGWLELASAKHSMGTSRVNTSVLDLKCHSAATTLKITENHDGTEPQFTLQKWVSSEHESTKLEDKNEHTQDSDTKSSATEATLTKNLTGLADNDEVSSKGARQVLVSFWSFDFAKASGHPAVIRESQDNTFCPSKFFVALETLIDIANMRSSVLNSFNQLHKEVEDTKE
ncbi:hypothetical protein TSUD_309570 [Trifolium subterraneum]|uniref:Vacuolar ATPase assembly protein VMA22 n=1 Tax=Trifolium subterraneum TaxID=3900 RepID=A0A2Z6LXG7_TRISU|nr:hypothetical protein TSUD_309570 [Trifolium subterraneum]